MTAVPVHLLPLALAGVALAGCDDVASTGQAGEVADPRIHCRPAGADAFTPVCRAERDGDLLVLFKPDGGFRRLRLDPEQGLLAADGAEPAQIGRTGEHELRVEIGGDVFLLPDRLAR